MTMATMAASMLIGAGNPFSVFCCCSQRRTGFLFSSPPTTLRSPVYRLIPPQLVTNSFSLSPWSGLKFLGFPSRQNYIRRERRGKYRGKVVYASLFGVGAPEALVIGVVALLIFGPKGLAEVARNLGKTLRAFQPTIRELQEVSREFKSTLEREIGLDEVTSSTNNMYKPPIVANDNQQAKIDPNGTPKVGAYTSEDLLKITEEQLATSATQSQSQTSTPPAQPQEIPANNPSEATTASAASEATAFTPSEASIQTPSSSEKTEKER